MKSLKILFAVAILVGSILCAHGTFSASNANLYASIRVRTVPSSSSSDQKKKEDENGVSPKPSTSSKNSSGLFCSQTNTLKATLTVANGGAPK